MAIKKVRLVLESDVLSLCGGAVINPPATLIESVDQELAKSGKIRSGDFATYIRTHGFGEPQITGSLTDNERMGVLRSIFPYDQWACCGRITEMNRYNVVVSFH